MRVLTCFLFLVFPALVMSDWEEGYRAFREDRWGKMTKPKPVQWPYPNSDIEFKIKQQWRQLPDERKFFWWWNAKYSMGATKKERDFMEEYSMKYFHLGVQDEQAPSFDEFLKGKKEARESAVAKNSLGQALPQDRTPAKPTPPTGVTTEDGALPAMDTAIGRYQNKLYLAIGSRWNLRIQQTMTQIGVDRVVIGFYVNPDGSISDLDVVQGNPNSLLAVVSADSIQQSSNLIGPFPDDLRKDKPNGFSWKLSFRTH